MGTLASTKTDSWRKKIVSSFLLTPSQMLADASYDMEDRSLLVDSQTDISIKPFDAEAGSPIPGSQPLLFLLSSGAKIFALKLNSIKFT